MHDQIRIINDAGEFLTLISNPSPDIWYCFLPKEYKIINKEEFVENILKHNNCLIYADVKIENGILFHPSFNEQLIHSQFQIISPLCYNGYQKIYVDVSKITTITDLAKQIFCIVPGHHIQTPLYELFPQYSS